VQARPGGVAKERSFESADETVVLMILVSEYGGAGKTNTGSNHVEFRCLHNS
jgi:hypothetical protein